MLATEIMRRSFARVKPTTRQIDAVRLRLERQSDLVPALQLWYCPAG